MSDPTPSAKTPAKGAPPAGGASGEPARASASPLRSKLVLVLSIVLPAVASAGASFASARAAVKNAHGPPPHVEPPRWDPAPPGPTMHLEPFLVTIQEGTKKSHAMKMTVAVEFNATVKEDALKAFTPRIRDSMLSHIRLQTYERVTDPAQGDALRKELLERCHTVGALAAERVLITDMVVQ